MTRLSLGLAGWLVMALPIGAQEARTPRDQMLLEPAALARSNAATDFVVLDARPQAKFADERIPRARWVDAAAWAKAFGEGKDAKGWSERLAQLGLTPQTAIVVYDDEQSKAAARIWWILRYWGFADVRLLNGGWVGWTQGKHPTEKGQALEVKAAAAAPLQPRTERIADKACVVEAAKNQQRQIVDARALDEFTGSKKSAERGGHVPSARHLDWAELVDAKTHRFKDEAALRALMVEAKIDPDKPVITYCQSGGRASVMQFALELLGAKDVRNYYPSWAEWGNATDVPVKTEDK